jgi:hypothetical protein
MHRDSTLENIDSRAAASHPRPHYGVLNNILLFATTMICAARSLSATCKRFDPAAILKGYEIRDVWRRQVQGRSLRWLEPFIGVISFDYVITLKFQHFSQQVPYGCISVKNQNPCHA